ncbi:Zn-dependent hydrolase [Peribacillus sp. NPDC097198]|uniref:Zn-dependent hydrolase n=1 Tax=Peribacillus sp. NPDC097198 TaxID=3364397 RepID=UPI0037F59202
MKHLRNLTNKVDVQINSNRLLSDIHKYAQYGKNLQGGVTRPSFSIADQDVRTLFIQELESIGLEVNIDGAANIWGIKKGNQKKKGSIVIGSHLDSVPNGGEYDGPLGVLMAKEIIQTLIDHNITLNHDVEIVSFTAEETNDFNLSTFGSRSFVGSLTADKLQNIYDTKGNSLHSELKKVGGNLNQFAKMEEMRRSKKVFIELHIEQGKRLERNNMAVAVIDKVVGTYRSKVKVIGESNHSGTTMMEDRKDALTATAEMILSIERYCNNIDNGVVGTVGTLNVFPNTANIIPGIVNFIFEIRGSSEEQIEKAIKTIQEIWQSIAKKRKVNVYQEVFLNQKPVVLDYDLVKILQKTAQEMSEPYMTFSSMAVHDAAHMSAIAKSVMIFVKSIDGKSHCPEEYSHADDIEKAGNLMLQSILKIDQELV